MDGVERVMVLGILAVIVAILSFAWSATEDDGLPVATGTTAGGLPTLSSNSRAGVIIPSPGLEDRLSDPERIAENRALLREQMLGGARPESSPFNGGNPVQGESTSGPASEAARQQPHPLPPSSLPPGRNGRRGAGKRAAAVDGAVPADDTNRGADAGADRPTTGAANRGGQRVTIIDPHSTVTPGTEAHVIERPGATPLKTQQAPEQGSDEPAWELYTLRQGDTLWSLASEAVDGGSGDVKATIALIQQLNPGLDADNLSVGRTIKMPLALDATIITRAPEQRVSVEGGRVYVVQEGDSLGGIAERELGAERRWKDIYDLNRHLITDPGSIRVGQRLVLPEE